MSFTIIGVGSMGTALAKALHHHHCPIQLIGKTNFPPLAQELGLPKQKVA